MENDDERNPTASSRLTSTLCPGCGSNKDSNSPPEQSPQASWSEVSPPPCYRPVRAPATFIPPTYSAQAVILAPVPQSEQVSVVSPPYSFQLPYKLIHSTDDVTVFLDSDCCRNFLGFIVALSESVRGHKISDPCHETQTVKMIMSILENLVHWISEIPPVEQSGRYGNLSYRTWHDRLLEKSESLMLKILPNELQMGVVEVTPYFKESFGNSSRIDYGTGHEMNFAAWLYCLSRIGIIKKEDYHSVVVRIFMKYLDLMRNLQLVYNLEPAGSHGVWGLDDYHFLPFIFGSSQLIDHKYMKPKSIHNEDILENFSTEYMYISCITFIKKVKRGPFNEHSPMLDDISGVHNWGKVNAGLLKMYKAEVLGKWPIMQHFLFGWLIHCPQLLKSKEDCEQNKPAESSPVG